MQTIGVSFARGDGLPVDLLVGLVEQPPPLGMPDDHVLGASLTQHRRADLAGEGAFFLPVQVLTGDADVGAPRRFRYRVQCRERRRDDDLHVEVLDETAEFLDEADRLEDGLVHLPVGGDKGSSHAEILSRAECYVLGATCFSCDVPRATCSCPDAWCRRTLHVAPKKHLARRT